MHWWTGTVSTIGNWASTICCPAEEKLLEYQLFRVPIVRNGKQATVGYCPDVWQTWE